MVVDGLVSCYGTANMAKEPAMSREEAFAYYQSKEPGVFCVANETPFAGTASNKVYMMSKDNPALLEKVNQWLDSQDKEVLKRKWKIRG